MPSPLSGPHFRVIINQVLFVWLSLRNVSKRQGYLLIFRLYLGGLVDQARMLEYMFQNSTHKKIWQIFQRPLDLICARMFAEKVSDEPNFHETMHAGFVWVTVAEALKVFAMDVRILLPYSSAETLHGVPHRSLQESQAVFSCEEVEPEFLQDLEDLDVLATNSEIGVLSTVMRRWTHPSGNNQIFATETFLVGLRWESRKKYQLAPSCSNGGKPTAFRVEGAIPTSFHLFFTTDPLPFPPLHTDHGFQSICVSLADRSAPIGPRNSLLVSSGFVPYAEPCSFQTPPQRTDS